MLKLYPFSLSFHQDEQGRPLFASFPFMMDGVPAAEISCALSSRFAGDMARNGVPAARPALFETLGLESSRVYGLDQIHSRRVLAVDRRGPPDISADGMVSADRDVVLSVTVADCLPVYLFDTGTGAFGLLHSGWKGTGIVLRALELMAERWHTGPGAVAAVLGPCIGSCCYQVDAARAAAFEEEFGSIAPPVGAGDSLKPVTRRETEPEGERWYLDLKAANIRLLAAAGVRNIAVCGDCTFTDERLGSFRREGPAYTRMAAICGHFSVP